MADGIPGPACGACGKPLPIEYSSGYCDRACATRARTTMLRRATQAEADLAAARAEVERLRPYAAVGDIYVAMHRPDVSWPVVREMRETLAEATRFAEGFPPPGAPPAPGTFTVCDVVQVTGPEGESIYGMIGTVVDPATFAGIPDLPNPGGVPVVFTYAGTSGPERLIGRVAPERLRVIGHTHLVPDQLPDDATGEGEGIVHLPDQGELRQLAADLMRERDGLRSERDALESCIVALTGEGLVAMTARQVAAESELARIRAALVAYCGSADPGLTGTPLTTEQLLELVIGRAAAGDRMTAAADPPIGGRLEEDLALYSTRVALGRMVRSARELAKLTMGDLARALGVPVTRVSDLERGRLELRRFGEHIGARDDLLRDILALASTYVPSEQIAGWTAEQRDIAEAWACAAYLSASDNEDVEVPPRPDFLPPAWSPDDLRPPAVRGEPVDPFLAAVPIASAEVIARDRARLESSAEARGPQPATPPWALDAEPRRYR